jgi:hypothetical protein
MTTTHSILLRVLAKPFPVNKVAAILNVADGTVKRWIDNGKTPSSYEIDLLRMLDEPIDYAKYSFTAKDQFFTPKETAKTCFDTVRAVLLKNGDDPDKYTYIEPSAGDGSFLSVLPQERRIGFDIEPRNPEVVQQDFLNWKPPESDLRPFVVVGNPPFGLRGNLALRFMNACYAYADYVCFILPQLFQSDGKGSARKRVHFNLIHSEKLQTAFYDPDQRVVKVECIFQIWSKIHSNPKYILSSHINNDITIYSLSDGGTSSSTRNKSKLRSCDVYLPSTCYGKDAMRAYESFEELPNRRGYGVVFRQERKPHMIQKCREASWSNVAFLSTNSALNLRRSSILEEIHKFT